MKKTLTITACSISLVFGSAAFAQTAATDTPSGGTLITDTSQSVAAWGVEDIFGKNIHNEQDEKIGDIRNLILNEKGQATHYIVGAGGFLGMGEHDAAIPFDKVKYNNEDFVLYGYTKDQLKELPEVDITNTAAHWGAKDIMGKNVHNEQDEKIGDIRNLTLNDKGQATHFIVGAGGFLGMGEHDVAIPFDRMTYRDDHFVLSGYTKDQLKELPKVEVRK